MTIRLERSYLQIPYRAVRTQLGLLDELVVVRVFGADSSAHRVLAQGLVQLDSLAANAFGPEPGAPERPSPAAATPARPAPSKTSAPETRASETSAPAEATQEIAPDEQEEIEHLADTYVAEQELAPLAGELAENDELRRVQAEIKAKQAVEDERGQL